MDSERIVTGLAHTSSRRAALRRFAAGGIATGALGLVWPRHAAALQETSPATPTTSARPLKVVLHVSDADSWPAAFSNLKNLTEQHPDASLRVVADGSGVYVFQGANDLTAEVAAYAAKGVTFEACANALREKQIDPASIPQSTVVVAGGVVALAHAQYDGYAYVKP